MIGSIVVSRAREMGLALPDGAGEQFDIYYRMLVETNKVMNLCRGLEDEGEAADRHFVDSLTLLLALDVPQGARVMDVGSGAGFPGIPLAIARPDMEILLLDSLGKRVRFLESVIGELGLHARAEHGRCEDAGREKGKREQYDLVTARAVASMNVLCEWLSPFCRVGGRVAALKGPSVDEEIKEAARAMRETRLRLDRVAAIAPPGRDWDHRVVLLTKTGPLPAAYPRKSGEARQKPL